MADLTVQKEVDSQDLMQLHKHLNGLEKIEIDSRRFTYPEQRTLHNYEVCFENIKEHVALVQEGLIKHVSPSLADLLGYPIKHMIGDFFAAHALPDELPKLLEIYKNRLAGKKAPNIYSSSLRHRTGKNIVVKIIAGLTTYMGKPASFAIFKEQILD